MRWLGALMLILPACASERHHRLINVGTLCVNTSPRSECTPVEVRADDTLNLFVDFGACFSGSCARRGPASCEAKLDGNRIVVSASGSYFDETHLIGSCTDDCNTITTECSVEAVPSGTYIVEYGDAAFDLEIPSRSARVCIDADHKSGTALECCNRDEDCTDGGCGDDNRCAAR